MRVAFGLIGGAGWTGGVNYLANLLSALSEIPGRPVETVLFTGIDVDDKTLEMLAPYLSEPPIKSELWTKGAPSHRSRFLRRLFLQRDISVEQVFRKAGIDLVFLHSAWYGCRFGLPTLAWIADFQHRYLPSLFSTENYWRREIGYRALARCATSILVSSEDARQDCEKFYPAACGRIEVLPFAVRIAPRILQQAPHVIREKYHLPEKFFFMPNQFWRHKNHLGVVEALKLMKAQGEKVTVAVSGNPQDVRDPEYPGRLFDTVREYGLENEFRLIGMIPYTDIVPLMRASVAVINPSFFEGWSTTVEEAKSVGAALLLSDIRVHREQAPAMCKFFDPHNPVNISEILISGWREWGPGPRPELESAASRNLIEWRAKFAERFQIIAERTIAGKAR